MGQRLPDNWRDHWQFFEGGAIALRTDMHPHQPKGPMSITVANGKVAFDYQRTRYGAPADRENARYFANRLFEAVAIAELQSIAYITPKEI